MLFNIDKRKVMHLGLNNVQAKCEMNGKYLEEVIEERDLTRNAWRVNKFLYYIVL